MIPTRVNHRSSRWKVDIVPSVEHEAEVNAALLHLRIGNRFSTRNCMSPTRQTRQPKGDMPILVIAVAKPYPGTHISQRVDGRSRIVRIVVKRLVLVARFRIAKHGAETLRGPMERCHELWLIPKARPAQPLCSSCVQRLLGITDQKREP